MPGNPAMNVVPNEKACGYGNTIFYLMFSVLLNTIFQAIAGNSTNTVYLIVNCCCGFCGTYSLPNSIKADKIIGLTFLSTYNAVQATVSAIMFVVNPILFMDEEGGFLLIAQASAFMLAISLLLVAYFAYYLYSELKSNYQPAPMEVNQGGMFGGMGGFGRGGMFGRGLGAGQQAAAGTPQPQQQAPQGAPQSGFVPFQGQGQRLGGGTSPSPNYVQSGNQMQQLPGNQNYNPNQSQQQNQGFVPFTGEGHRLN